jgi:hypothetical protein
MAAWALRLTDRYYNKVGQLGSSPGQFPKSMFEEMGMFLVSMLSSRLSKGLRKNIIPTTKKNGFWNFLQPMPSIVVVELRQA